MNLKNKKILLIIGGGISAYKSLDLIRLLLRKGCSVKVILTKTGKKFVTPLSISSLSKNRVFEDTFDEKIMVKWIIFHFRVGQMLFWFYQQLQI